MGGPAMAAWLGSAATRLALRWWIGTAALAVLGSMVEHYLEGHAPCTMKSSWGMPLMVAAAVGAKPKFQSASDLISNLNQI